MRLVTGLLALLLVLVVVAWGARQSLKSSRVTLPDAVASSPVGEAPKPLTPQQQVQSFQKELQQAVDQGAAARASDAP